MDPCYFWLRIGLLPVTGVFSRRCRIVSTGNKSNLSHQDKPITDDTIFKVVKEIVVKFIEVGRLTPTNFEETYNQVYKTVKNSVRSE